MPLTVFERWTDYGEEMALKTLLGQAGSSWTSVQVHLFKSPTTDPEDETPTLVEADFTGYTAVSISWNPATGPSVWQSIASMAVFNRAWLVAPPDPDPDAGTSNTIYGYYLTNGSSGFDAEEPLYYRFFNDGTDLTPKSMTTPESDQITIIARINLIGLEDVVCP